MTIRLRYREADLDYIFIRAQRDDGSWGSLSLNEISPQKFQTWAKEKFDLDDKELVGKNWTSQDKVDLLNKITKRLGRPAIAMVRREARNEWRKGKK